LETSSVTIHQITSVARAVLAEAIAARDAIVAEQDRLRLARDRLASAATGAETHERALAILDQQESQAALAWAHEPEGTAPPQPDAQKRAQLTAALSAARAAAQAAKTAIPDLEAKFAQVALPMPSIVVAIANATAQILAEEADALIADFEESQRETAAKASRLQIALEEITTIAEGGPSDSMRPAFEARAALNERMRKAGARTIDDALAAEHRMGWRHLADALRSDANAKLEG
jgi:hypothetical protein